MEIIRKSFYSIEELMQFLKTQGYSDYKYGALLDQAMKNYNDTGKWDIDMAIPATATLR